MNLSLNDSLPKTTYQAIVCDDESYIANSTAMLLRMRPEWDLDVTICTTPQSALHRIQAGRVDLLVADICMPGVSGLDVMRAALGLWPMCQVILLTAHSQFDYVYDAIQHENVSYILKCDGHEALLEAAGRCLERLNSAARQEMVVERAREQARSALPYLQREYVLDLVHGVSYTREQRDRVRRELSLPLDLEESFSGWLMLLEVYKDTFLERSQRMHLILSALSRYLPETARLLSVPLDSQRTLCLAQTEAGEAFPSVQLEGILESLQQASYDQMALPFSVAYCQEIKGFRELPACYARMNLVKASMAVGQENMWLMEARERGIKKPPLLDGQYVVNARLWRHAFENGDPGADGMLERLLAPLRTAPSFQDPVAMEMYLQLALQIVQLIRNGQGEEETVSASRLMRADQHESPAAAALALKDAVNAIRAGRRETSSTSIRETVEKVSGYIKEHLREDISLTRLAEYAGVNTSYLSRIFRKATGETLIHYVSAVKMDHAYTLLRDRKARIQQISQELGFLTPAYFSYFFKKNAGCTPSEYRERFRR